jgi:hypothetical protein
MAYVFSAGGIVAKIIRRILSFVLSLTMFLGGSWLIIQQLLAYGIAIRGATAGVFCVMRLGGGWFYGDFVAPLFSRDSAER